MPERSLTADEALELLDAALYAEVDGLLVTKVDDEPSEEVRLDLVCDLEALVLLADLGRLDRLLELVDRRLVELRGGCEVLWGPIKIRGGERIYTHRTPGTRRGTADAQVMVMVSSPL